MFPSENLNSIAAVSGFAIRSCFKNKIWDFMKIATILKSATKTTHIFI